jgi:poly-gamma-glutamate capsule biosynthesis protein CapA/YwtB (metallophosphatase superfamily)
MCTGRGQGTGGLPVGLWRDRSSMGCPVTTPSQQRMEVRPAADIEERHPRCVTLFLCGDLMTGRGVDQILPHPSEPHLCESYVKSAVEYVELAEASGGPVPRPAAFEYVWGDALRELERVRPAARIVNLETAVTVNGEPWPQKDIHYRMHPGNVPCLTTARIDCCVLANNHVLDWGRPGLKETLHSLHAAGIRTAGAGADETEAESAAAIDVSSANRVLVYGFAARSSGVPRAWKATDRQPGVNWLEDLSPNTAEVIGRRMSRYRRHGDVVVASIHWGGNWGYRIPREERRFAHRLIETAGVDVVHGHSSHHVKGIEVYQRKLILYGCGDLLNDYEGISGYGSFRGELALMYFPTVDASTGDLVGLTMTPTRTRGLRINLASPEDAVWLQKTLDQECSRLGGRVTQHADGRLVLQW